MGVYQGVFLPIRQVIPGLGGLLLQLPLLGQVVEVAVVPTCSPFDGWETKKPLADAVPREAQQSTLPLGVQRVERRRFLGFTKEPIAPKKAQQDWPFRADAPKGAKHREPLLLFDQVGPHAPAGKHAIEEAASSFCPPLNAPRLN